MIKKVLQYIKENNMFQVQDKVLVALSGGPDSMCLLHMLYSLKEELGITLIAAHINHCLRGEDSDEDERYVKNICREMKIECYSRKINIHKLATKENISCEMAGREARYAFFEEIKNKTNVQKIALAHNANDQAETILMRIMRGTGMEGLIGIRPIRDGIFVRPILLLTRKEIESYCSEHEINARIDKSNLEDIYARNKVRLQLIPYMQENFNLDIIQVLNRLSDTIKRDNEYLEQISLEKYKRYCEKRDKRVIIQCEAFSEHESILTRIIRSAVADLTGSLNNLEKIHIYDIIDIQKKGTGRKIDLPSGVVATSVYGNIALSFSSAKKDKHIENKVTYPLELDKTQYIDKYKINVKLKLMNCNEKINFIGEPLVKYFDFDKIKGEILLRSRKEGDKFTPLGMKGCKKIKDLFIDLKIPKDERDFIPLLCFGEEVAWIVGYRVSERYKIEPHTKQIVEIRIEREEKNEE